MKLASSFAVCVCVCVCVWADKKKTVAGPPGIQQGGAGGGEAQLLRCTAVCRACSLALRVCDTRMQRRYTEAVSVCVCVCVFAFVCVCVCDTQYTVIYVISA
jgi:hypothetical protein